MWFTHMHIVCKNLQSIEGGRLNQKKKKNPMSPNRPTFLDEVISQKGFSLMPKGSRILSMEPFCNSTSLGAMISSWIHRLLQPKSHPPTGLPCTIIMIKIICLKRLCDEISQNWQNLYIFMTSRQSSSV